MIAQRKRRKPKQPIIPPVSAARQKIFADNHCAEKTSQALHEQIVRLLDFACEQFKVQRTGDDELDGNNVLIAHFKSLERLRARDHQRAAAELDRAQKREQRFNNPSISFAVESWTDWYGEIVKVGDTIRFMTLYGERLAVVRAIEQDIDYRDQGYLLLNPVVFIIDPFQPEGFEDVFQPCSRIVSESTSNPCKWIGRERSEEEIRAAIQNFGGQA